MADIIVWHQACPMMMMSNQTKKKNSSIAYLLEGVSGCIA
jgi:hypothetical protein